jgi:hypothetical protein
MTYANDTDSPTVVAYFSLGNSRMGVCKELIISLQRRCAATKARASIIPFRKPVNRSERHLSDPRDR